MTPIKPPSPAPSSSPSSAKQNPRKNTKPKRWVPTAILIGLIAILFADYKGWLLPIQDTLDQPDFTYNFGQYQLNLYSILQSALVIIVIAWLAYWASRLIERRVSQMKNIHPSSKTLIEKILIVFLYIIAGLLTINVLGIDLTSFSIIGGAIGIGLGFGLQKIASNFISGLILLLERSVKIGDTIEMEDGTLGVVKKNSARYTLIETGNMREIMIPNEQFVVDKVINWTLNNRQGRVDINVSVSYASDLNLVMATMLDAAKAHPATISNPAPVCYLKKFGTHGVEFSLLVWISDITLGRDAIQSEIMLDIWNRFRDNKIAIPVPTDITVQSSNLK